MMFDGRPASSKVVFAVNKVVSPSQAQTCTYQITRQQVQKVRKSRNTKNTDKPIVTVSKVSPAAGQ